MWQRLNNFKQSINDYTMAINLNPVYAAAYYNRSLAKNSINDFRGADEDYKTSVKIDSHFEKIMQSGQIDSTGLARMAEFNADFNDDNVESPERLEMSPFPNFNVNFKILSSAAGTAKRNTIHQIEEMNKGLYAEEFLITPNEVKNSTEKVKALIAMLDTVEVTPQNWLKIYERAILKFQLQHFIGSIEDYTSMIAIKPNLAIAYFNRGNTRYEMVSYMNSLDNMSNINLSMGNSNQGSIKTLHAKNFDDVIADYTACIKLEPGFYHAYFNRANIKILSNDYVGAIWDYTRAIAYETKFAEAYYNRGLTYIYIRKSNEGCTDLSKAGELGIERAYDVIKKFCKD
jgi:tetratricopeptide (TPR) repeat protein